MMGTRWPFSLLLFFFFSFCFSSQASPIAQRGMSATFTDFSIGPLKKGTHDPNLSEDCGAPPPEADESPEAEL